MELEMFDNPSIVFQIEYRPGMFVYHWMVDVIMTSSEITIADFLLDLTSFPAESRLNVSFAYVTEESGLSTFSDPTTIQLSGIELCTNDNNTDMYLLQRHVLSGH